MKDEGNPREAREARIEEAVGLRHAVVTHERIAQESQDVYRLALAFQAEIRVADKARYSTTPEALEENLVKLLRLVTLGTLVEYLRDHDSEALKSMLDRARSEGFDEAVRAVNTPSLN